MCITKPLGLSIFSSETASLSVISYPFWNFDPQIMIIMVHVWPIKILTWLQCFMHGATFVFHLVSLCAKGILKNLQFSPYRLDHFRILICWTWVVELKFELKWVQHTFSNVLCALTMFTCILIILPNKFFLKNPLCDLSSNET